MRSSSTTGTKCFADTATLAGIEAYRKRLGATELDYLAACCAAERQMRGPGAARAGARRRATRRHRRGPGRLDQSRPTLRRRARLVLCPCGRTRSPGPPLCPHYGGRAGAEAGPGFSECAERIAPEMIVVPVGIVHDGLAGDRNRPRRQIEGPQHAVTIANPFAVSEFEVTFADWDACVSPTRRLPPEYQRFRFWAAVTKPAINVTWGDAQRYVAWLSHQDDRRALPAADRGRIRICGARRESPADHPIRGAPSPATAMPIATAAAARGTNEETAPVGSFAPNRFGLYDMVGDVWAVGRGLLQRQL